MTESLPREYLPVIFRADKYGEEKGAITAIFPTLPGTSAGDDYTCYTHIGQHSFASYGWYIKRTRQAKPSEYRELLTELRRIYETPEPGDTTHLRLVVFKRMTKQHRKEFDKKLGR